ncbi:MAG: thioredoxin family protein [Candidatus Krumholzibacteria bacterium]|nr:thioredoxin family protein [Candidatus Krumholzibacteria bacterium]
MEFVRRSSVALVLGILLTMTSQVPEVVAGSIEIKVVPRSETAEIGKDLVLEVEITPAPGEAVVVSGLDIDVTTSDDQEFFGDPYPIKPLSPAGSDPATYEGAARFEWAAPVGLDVKPLAANLIVKVTARTTAGATESAEWSGAINVDYGEGWSADKISNFIERKGIGFFLLLVFGFGVLMSLSPCIYPMIPITLVVIGAQSQEKGPVRGLIMSITYVIGMALVYAIMGALSATVFSGITAFMQSPVVLVPIAILLLGLSFSMFGAFELEAPVFLRDRLQGPGAGNRGGLIGVFAMGLVAGLVASPCVGPFLMALLVWVGTTGDWILGFFSLFTFGIGMGLLLIGIGTFPALVGTLPRSGSWMDTVKKGMGLLLVAMAFYFVRPGSVLPANIFYPLVGVATILTAVFMGAFDSLAPEAGWWPRTLKGLGLVVFVAGLYFLGGSFIQHGFMMPSPLAEISSGPGSETHPTPVRIGSAVETATTGEPIAVTLPEKVQWTKIHTGENVQAFLDRKRAEAKAAGRPVMIDFWAQWCVYCKKLDKLVWNVPEVAEEAQRFVTIKVDATAPDDAEMTSIREYFKVPGLPRIIFIDSRGEVLHGRSSGWKTADDMLELMKSIR